MKFDKALITKYGICFGVASLIALAVFWSKGFFGHGLAVDIQILSDGFFVSGILLVLFAGMMYISSEGALLGVGYMLKNAFLAFIPGGRSRQELFKDYRERKMQELKKSADRCVLVVGLIFLAVGVVLTVIWYTNFYIPPAQ